MKLRETESVKDLVVDERYPEDVGEEEDDFIVGVVARGRCGVALYSRDCLDLS